MLVYKSENYLRIDPFLIAFHLINMVHSIYLVNLAVIFIAFIVIEINATKYDAIIVGGGMAGLSAAAHLIQNGKTNIVIFEGQDVAGGRIKTQPVAAGRCLDFGAQWILGGRVVNSVFNLANSYNLITNSSSFYNDSGIYVRANGTVMDEGFSSKVRAMLREIVDNLPFGPIRPHLLPTSPKMKTLFAQFPMDRDNVHEILNQYRNELAFELGDDLESIIYDPRFVEIKDDVVLDNYCMDELVRILVNQIGAAKIHYKSEVSKIEWGGADNVVHVKSSPTAAPVQHHAKFVVVTSSIGFLKAEHTKLFHPALPAEKLTSLKNIHFGQGEKIFACFQRPFWMRGHTNYLKFGRPESEFAQIGTVWVRRIPGFWEVRKHPKCLMTAIFGKVSRTIPKVEQQLKLQIRDVLRKFTGDPSIPMPEMIYRTNWNDNRFVRGTFSAPGLTFKQGDFMRMSLPLYVGGKMRVIFAGEGVSSYYHGTMHGARNTGLRAANLILEAKY